MFCFYLNQIEPRGKVTRSDLDTSTWRSEKKDLFKFDHLCFADSQPFQNKELFTFRVFSNILS